MTRAKVFAYNAVQRDTAVVVKIAAVTLVLVQGYDDDIPHVLRHRVLLPALAERGSRSLVSSTGLAHLMIYGEMS